MKAYRHITSIIFLLLLARTSDCTAAGRDFTVTTVSDSEIKGELLSVRSDAMLLLVGTKASNYFLPSHVEQIIRISFAEVKVIHANADSHTGSGILWGSMIGLVAGIFVGQAVHSDAQGYSAIAPGNQVAAGLACVAAGAVTGGIIGNKASEEEINLIGPTAIELLQLRQYARYSQQEPEFLQQVE